MSPCAPVPPSLPPHMFQPPPSPSHQELKDSHLLPISEDKVVEGKGQSPFDPAHKHTAVLVGEYQVP